MFQPRRPIAIHPGEILREEFMKPHGLTQTKLASALGIPLQRVNLLLNAKRGVTPDTAYRLARYFGTSVELWMGLQQDWDIRAARDAGIERAIAKVRPLRRSA
jgi:addiction module HigA family antidote